MHVLCALRLETQGEENKDHICPMSSADHSPPFNTNFPKLINSQMLPQQNIRKRPPYATAALITLSCWRNLRAVKQQLSGYLFSTVVQECRCTRKAGVAGEHPKLERKKESGLCIKVKESVTVVGFSSPGQLRSGTS